MSLQLGAVPSSGLPKVAQVSSEVHRVWYSLPSTTSVLHSFVLSIPPGRCVDSSILQIRQNRGPERFNNVSKVTQLVRGMLTAKQSWNLRICRFWPILPLGISECSVHILEPVGFREGRKTEFIYLFIGSSPSQ